MTLRRAVGIDSRSTPVVPAFRHDDYAHFLPSEDTSIALAELFDTLDVASYGAYVMDPERRILFWNRSAERILGHKAEEVVGRQCYEALFGLPEQPSVPTCTRECLTVSLAQTRRLAPVARVRMRCASGGWKRVEVMTLTVPESESSVLVHCFYEQAGGVRTGRNEHPTRIGVAPRTPEALSGSASRGRGESLTSRELEVVALLAAREPIASIGGRLHLSSHTVLNHVRNAREKLGARTRLDLVLEAQRRGLV